MIEFKDFAERLGYEEHVTFHYSATNVRVLEEDMDLMALISMVGRDRVVEIFMLVHINHWLLIIVEQLSVFSYSSNESNEDVNVEEVEVEDDQ